MLRRAFKHAIDKVSDVLDTDEQIYVQRSRRSSDVRNSNVPYEISSTQSNEPGEMNTSSAWKEHVSSQLELQEYDSNWPKMYQEEYNRIKNCFKNRSQPLVLDMEHVGSTSVEEMCAKPIIDILIICGNYIENTGPSTIEETCDILMKNGYQPRYAYDLADRHSCRKWMQKDGILVKKGFIIHLVSSLYLRWQTDLSFIACREYLRTHTDARMNYNRCKNSIASDRGQDLTIKEYGLQKDAFVKTLVDEAMKWVRETLHCTHIGAFDRAKKRWACCNTGEDEGGSDKNKSGCYYAGSKKDNYHPGHFYKLENNFIIGWYECCSQGRYSDGCVKVMLLENDEALLRKCEEWDVDNVCRWIRSLSQLDTDYSKSFQENRINGRILLTVVDDETLQELGIANFIHRKLFRKAIKELRRESSTAPAPSDATGWLVSKNESNKSYSNDFQGDFAPLLPPNEMSKNSPYPNVSVCQLTHQSHPKIISRIYNWLGQLPNQRRVDKIEYVFNPGRYRIFLGQLESIENRQIQTTFQPTLNLENNCEERELVMERLDALCSQVSHNRKARIVRMWHGCRQNVLPDLLSDGFAALGTFDEGWYGKAIYFTSSAKYAAQYCGDNNGCLIMCYILLLNPFPVVSADAPPKVSQAQFRFYGRGNHKNYESHYVPVSPVDGFNTLDCRPPPTGTQDALFDELAVFQESHILPQVVVHLR